MNAGWKMTTIGEQVLLQRGYDITKLEQRPGCIPVVSAGGIFSYHDTVIAKGPGVVVSRKGNSIGRVQYVATDYWPHDTTLWVKDFRGNCPRFVYYFFSNLYPRLAALDVGSANPTLNRNHVHPTETIWPPTDEQEAIAQVLGSLDDKIELNRRTNETLEAMARTLFRSWFVDFDPVRAKVDGEQPHGMDAATAKMFPNSFDSSALGPIPNGWRVGSLAETLSELETGNRPKGGVSGISSGVPSIGAESINGLGVFDFAKTRFVPQAFFDSMGRGHVRNRDVLLYKDGGRPGMFEPHVAMFGDGFPFGVCSINEHVYRLRANEHLSQAFLYFWLSEELALAEMRVKGTGVAVPGLNSTAVRSLKVIIPRKEIVSAFDRFAEPLIAAILSNANQQVTLAATRDALLPKLMSGEAVAH